MSESKDLNLTVVVPVYNHAHFLRYAVESCVLQSVPPKEIIIIDDGSTDNSWVLAQKLEKRHDNVTAVRNKKNKGVIYSMNRGTEIAKSEFILYRSADDISLPGSFAKVHQILMHKKKCDLIVGEVIFFKEKVEDGTKESLGLSKRATFISPDQLIKKWNPDSIIPGSSTIVRRHSVMKVGNFKETLRGYCDWYMFLKLAFDGGLFFCPQPFSGARLSSHSYGNAKLSEEKTQNKLYKNILRFLDKENSNIIDAFAKTGALEVFGPKLVEYYENSFQEIRINNKSLLNKPIKRWTANGVKNELRNNPIANVIREHLQNKTKEILSFTQKPLIYVYGAGMHTDNLLNVWEEFKFPRISLIIVSEESKIKKFLGIPVHKICIKLKKPDIVIISSRSFEDIMYDNCKSNFSDSKTITFWSSHK
jgi:glycosyltransferase involved in cell wall biosynthesis